MGSRSSDSGPAGSESSSEQDWVELRLTGDGEDECELPSAQITFTDKAAEKVFQQGLTDAIDAINQLLGTDDVDLFVGTDSTSKDERPFAEEAGSPPSLETDRYKALLRKEKQALERSRSNTLDTRIDFAPNNLSDLDPQQQATVIKARSRLTECHVKAMAQNLESNPNEQYKSYAVGKITEYFAEIIKMAQLADQLPVSVPQISEEQATAIIDSLRPPPNRRKRQASSQQQQPAVTQSADGASRGDSDSSAEMAVEVGDTGTSLDSVSLATLHSTVLGAIKSISRVIKSVGPQDIRQLRERLKALANEANAQGQQRGPLVSQMLEMLQGAMRQSSVTAAARSRDGAWQKTEAAVRRLGNQFQSSSAAKGDHESIEREPSLSTEQGPNEDPELTRLEPPAASIGYEAVADKALATTGASRDAEISVLEASIAALKALLKEKAKGAEVVRELEGAEALLQRLTRRSSQTPSKSAGQEPTLEDRIKSRRRELEADKGNRKPQPTNEELEEALRSASGRLKKLLASVGERGSSQPQAPAFSDLTFEQATTVAGPDHPLETATPTQHQVLVGDDQATPPGPALFSEPSSVEPDQGNVTGQEKKPDRRQGDTEPSFADIQRAAAHTGRGRFVRWTFAAFAAVVSVGSFGRAFRNANGENANLLRLPAPGDNGYTGYPSAVEHRNYAGLLGQPAGDIGAYQPGSAYHQNQSGAVSLVPSVEYGLAPSSFAAWTADGRRLPVMLTPSSVDLRDSRRSQDVDNVIQSPTSDMEGGRMRTTTFLTLAGAATAALQAGDNAYGQPVSALFDDSALLPDGFTYTLDDGLPWSAALSRQSTSSGDPNNAESQVGATKDNRSLHHWSAGVFDERTPSLVGWNVSLDDIELPDDDGDELRTESAQANTTINNTDGTEASAFDTASTAATRLDAPSNEVTTDTDDAQPQVADHQARMTHEAMARRLQRAYREKLAAQQAKAENARALIARPGNPAADSALAEAAIPAEDTRTEHSLTARGPDGEELPVAFEEPGQRTVIQPAVLAEPQPPTDLTAVGPDGEQLPVAGNRAQWTPTDIDSTQAAQSMLPTDETPCADNTNASDVQSGEGICLPDEAPSTNRAGHQTAQQAAKTAVQGLGAGAAAAAVPLLNRMLGARAQRQQQDRRTQHRVDGISTTLQDMLARLALVKDPNETIAQRTDAPTEGWGLVDRRASKFGNDALSAEQQAELNTFRSEVVPMVATFFNPSFTPPQLQSHYKAIAAKTNDGLDDAHKIPQSISLEQAQDLRVAMQVDAIMGPLPVIAESEQRQQLRQLLTVGLLPGDGDVRVPDTEPVVTLTAAQRATIRRTTDELLRTGALATLNELNADGIYTANFDALTQRREALAQALAVDDTGMTSEQVATSLSEAGGFASSISSNIPADLRTDAVPSLRESAQAWIGATDATSMAALRFLQNRMLADWHQRARDCANAAELNEVIREAESTVDAIGDLDGDDKSALKVSIKLRLSLSALEAQHTANPDVDLSGFITLVDKAIESRQAETQKVLEIAPWQHYFQQMFTTYYTKMRPWLASMMGTQGPLGFADQADKYTEAVAYRAYQEAGNFYQRLERELAEGYLAQQGTANQKAAGKIEEYHGILEKTLGYLQAEHRRLHKLLRQTQSASAAINNLDEGCRNRLGMDEQQLSLQQRDLQQRLDYLEGLIDQNLALKSWLPKREASGKRRVYVPHGFRHKEVTGASADGEVARVAAHTHGSTVAVDKGLHADVFYDKQSTNVPDASQQPSPDGVQPTQDIFTRIEFLRGRNSVKMAFVQSTDAGQPLEDNGRPQTFNVTRGRGLSALSEVERDLVFAKARESMMALIIGAGKLPTKGLPIIISDSGDKALAVALMCQATSILRALGKGDLVKHLQFENPELRAEYGTRKWMDSVFYTDGDRPAINTLLQEYPTQTSFDAEQVCALQTHLSEGMDVADSQQAFKASLASARRGGESLDTSGVGHTAANDLPPPPVCGG